MVFGISFNLKMQKMGSFAMFGGRGDFDFTFFGKERKWMEILGLGTPIYPFSVFVGRCILLDSKQGCYHSVLDRPFLHHYSASLKFVFNFLISIRPLWNSRIHPFMILILFYSAKFINSSG